MKVLVSLALGITHAPPPDFCSILQNLRFGIFTLLPEYPLRYCQFTATAGGGNRGGGGVQTMKGEETGENPRRGKQAGGKACPALLAIVSKFMEETPRKPMLPAKIMLAFHFMWFDWNYMVTKVPVPLASGITNVPPPDFCSILQNLRFGVFTLLPEYPLRYC